MKRTQRIDLLTTIRGTIVSFFAITMFVALGVGLFLGIHWIAGAMHATVGAQLVEGHAHDVEIMFPYGLTPDDVVRLQALDPDDLEIETSWMSFQEVPSGTRSLTTRVGTLPESIDAFVEVEGALPAKRNEIALSATTAAANGYQIGDTITFAADGQDGKKMRYLNDATYTITALVTSPAYLATSVATYGMSLSSGTIDILAWVPAEAFRQDAFLYSYPYVLVRSKRLAQMDPFGDEYKQAVGELEARIRDLGDDLGSSRLETLHGLGSMVNDKRLDQLAVYAKTYADLVTRHEAGTLSDKEYQARRDDLGKKLQKTAESLGLPIGRVDHTNIDAAIGLAMPAAGLVSDAWFSELRRGLSSMVDYIWIVLSRPYNGASVLMDGFTGMTANLRWSMASLFLIVGILVCYSAVSRIVHEHVSRIGTKKALGFRRREVSALFLWYVGICVVVGLALGLVVAYVVELILLHVLSSRFVEAFSPFMNPTDVLVIGLLQLSLILGAAWFAVSGVLKRHAVDLLAGERPPTAKARFYESWGVWKRMSLLVQTTVNNCVNERRRVVGTLVGVAGCTALIVCAIMLQDDVMSSFTHQYEEISHYDAVASVQAGSKAVTEGAKKLADAGMDATAVDQRSLTLRQPDGSLSVATVTVPMDGDAFARLMTVRPVGPVGDAAGAWVSQAYHEHLGANVGDTIVLEDMTGHQSELKIAGFFEWHLLSNQIIVSEDLYEQSFGIKPSANKLLVNTKGQGAQAVIAAMDGVDGYASTRDDRGSNQAGFTEFARLSRIVVLVYLALAVMMAACVLLNLDFMFVDEKKRELIVLMICGYSRRDAKGYIWHDSAALTALGIVCGLVFGSVVGQFTILSVERANTSFLHGVSWLAVGIATAGTVVLAGMAMMFALRRINRFDLTDINRF